MLHVYLYSIQISHSEAIQCVNTHCHDVTNPSEYLLWFKLCQSWDICTINLVCTKILQNFLSIQVNSFLIPFICPFFSFCICMLYTSPPVCIACCVCSSFRLSISFAFQVSDSKLDATIPKRRIRRRRYSGSERQVLPQNAEEVWWNFNLKMF